MRDRMIVLIIVLGLVSLACLATGATGNLAGAPVATASSTVSPAGESLHLAVSAASEPTETTLICVMTSAEEAQNLRESPGVGARVVGTLRPGEVWTVIDQARADWWQVQHSGLVGWARAVYLVKVDCVEDK